MSHQEIQAIKSQYYTEAKGFFDNAKASLKKANKRNNIYNDIKFVRTACGMAYLGVLVAMQGYCKIKNIVPKKGEKMDIYFFEKVLPKINNKLFTEFDLVYKILLRLGYYDGINDAIVINRGFEHANKILEKIKPANAYN